MKSVFLSVALFFSASIGSGIRAQTTGHQDASVPAGTALHVRTIDPIDADRRDLKIDSFNNKNNPVVSTVAGSRAAAAGRCR